MPEPGLVAAYRHVRWNSYERWLRFAEGRETVIQVAAAFAFALATAAAAQVELHTPLSPVPYTLQVLPVLVSGAVLGAAWGAASMAIYLGLGVAGAPVFAGGTGGWAAVAGLTGGYLVGFVLASAFVGWAVHRRTLHPNRALLVAAPLGLLGIVALAGLDVWLLASRPSYLDTIWSRAYSSRDALVAFVALAGALAASAALAAYAWFRRAASDRIETLLAMVAGVVVVYAAGALGFWAAASGGAAQEPVTFAQVIELAVVPFVPVDLAKATLALGIVTLALPHRAERLYRRP